MTASPWSTATRDALVEWFNETLTPEIIASVVPEADPLRTWWTAAEPDAIARLVDLLIGGADHLTLLALVQRARLVEIPPATFDERLASELAQLAMWMRTASTATTTEINETFLCYAHEDMERAIAIQRLLAAGGVAIFRDVEKIRPGESITTRLNQVMASAQSAVVIVSEYSECSEWVRRERFRLLSRHARDEVLVLPVLVDDVPLPKEIADLFTIDLRGYGGAHDNDWARARLAPLVQRLAVLRGDTCSSLE